MGDAISAIHTPASIMGVVPRFFFKVCGLVVKEVCDIPDLESRWA